MSDDPHREAYVAALRLLAGRDLSRSELRERLMRRAFSSQTADAAVSRLAEERALDDFRVAVGRARCAAARHRGRARAAAQIQAAGIDREVARRALDEVFGATDERDLIEQALARRLKAPFVASPAEFRRLHAFLLRQGFAPADALAVLRAHARGAKVETGDEE